LTEVDKSGCVLVFCTRAYFAKRNSMKELYRAAARRRPILAMLDPDESQDGGLDRRAIEVSLTNELLDGFGLRMKWSEWKWEETDGFGRSAPGGADVAAALFAADPVEWNRLPHFQDVTIRLIAQRGVLHDKAGKLYLHGEAATRKVVLQPPYKGRRHHLFCSPHNKGAAELANELRASPVIAAGELKWTTQVDELEQCDHMLVLLDNRTWTSEKTKERFVDDVQSAMTCGVHILCVHEFPSLVGDDRHACNFDLMFKDDWTPPHLQKGPCNMYRQIAIALKAKEWRTPGLVTLASTLAAGGGEHSPIAAAGRTQATSAPVPLSTSALAREICDQISSTSEPSIREPSTSSARKFSSLANPIASTSSVRKFSCLAKRTAGARNSAAWSSGERITLSKPRCLRSGCESCESFDVSVPAAKNKPMRERTASTRKPSTSSVQKMQSQADCTGRARNSAAWSSEERVTLSKPNRLRMGVESCRSRSVTRLEGNIETPPSEPAYSSQPKAISRQSANLYLYDRHTLFLKHAVGGNALPAAFQLPPPTQAGPQPLPSGRAMKPRSTLTAGKTSEVVHL